MNIEKTLEERGTRYGDFKDVAETTYQLQEVLKRSQASRMKPSQIIAFDMICNKMARIDELQARVGAQEKHIKMALIAVKDIHKSAVDEYREWDVLKEKTPKLCEYLQNLSVAVGELEEALKGGEV